MRRILTLLVVGALVVLVQAPVVSASGPIVVVFESAASANGSGTTITLSSFIVTAADNRLLVVGISTKALSGSVTGVTFDGQNLTQEIQVAQAAASTSGANSEIWYLVAPNVTTADIVVTFNSSVQAVVGATLYSHVDQSNPTGVANTNVFPAANTNSTTLNGSEAVGSLIFSTVAMTGIVGIHDGISGLFGSIEPFAASERYEDGSSGAVLVGGAGSTIAATDPITLQWDWTAKTSSCCDTAMTAVEIRAVDVTVNTPPTANAGGPYTVGEGGSVVLSGAGSSDPDQSTASLTFKWDLDNDTMFDDATGITTAFSASGVDGIGQVVTVGLEVSDSDGASDTTTTTVTINNVAPSVTAALDLPEVLLGLTVSTNTTFSDPGLTDSPWTYVITWGDTSMDSGSTSNQSAAIVESHVYSAPGMFTVGVCVTDKDSGVGCDSTMITVLTPEEALENLGTDIDDLETMAVLTTGQANALTQKTAAATNKLDMGNKVAALNQLNAFINHVNALVTGGVLTPSEGQTLIDQVNLIIDSINATC